MGLLSSWKEPKRKCRAWQLWWRTSSWAAQNDGLNNSKRCGNAPVETGSSSQSTNTMPKLLSCKYGANGECHYTTENRNALSSHHHRCSLNPKNANAKPYPCPHHDKGCEFTSRSKSTSGKDVRMRNAILRISRITPVYAPTRIIEPGPRLSCTSVIVPFA